MTVLGSEESCRQRIESDRVHREIAARQILVQRAHVGDATGAVLAGAAGSHDADGHDGQPSGAERPERQTEEN